MKRRAITYVALLRGINVGGNALVRMAALKTTFERLGFANVSTYINSGNVFFQSGERDPRALEARIEKALIKDHKLGARVIVRDFPAMEALVKGLPESWDGSAQWQFNVIFLRHTVDSKKILDGLSPKPEIEEVIYRSGTLLWAARRSTITRSAMLKLSRQAVYQEVTVRNLNTTKKLYELMKRMTATS
jgi:uncharacterized protein (DUF1697 family)